MNYCGWRGRWRGGTIGASELIGSLLRSSRPSTLTRAICELGRVAKTLYLLSYLDDETYRRRIFTQLNRGESRHGMARAIFHGQRGEVRQRYREGQEDQLGALGLVVNVVVLWNTLYMDAALAHLRRRGVETKPEDVARISPLGHENINFLGRYSFALSDSIARGGLRPLHDPQETGGVAGPRGLTRLSVCAVERCRSSAGATPARQLWSFQPVAIGAAVEVTKPSEPSMERVV